MSKVDDRQMPCGRCPAGIYAPEAVLGGIDLFGTAESQRGALRDAPRCKGDDTKICMGCRDFIVACWPIDRARLMEEIGHG